MSNYDPTANVLFNSTSWGQSASISAAGNSGSKLIDLRLTQDVALSVTVTAPTGTTPGLVVGLDIQDACGNWIPQVIKTASITGAGTTIVYGGMHAGSSQVVLTERGRISWTVSGTTPVFPSVQISLIGR